MRLRIPAIVAAIIGAQALLVMAGWVFGIDALTRLIPVGINMKFVTAFLFFSCAIGLYLLSRAVQDGSEGALVVLPGISLIIFLITVTLFVSRLLGTPTGIEDVFLSHGDPVDYTGALPTEGWPAIPTLVNFILFGLVGIVSLFTGAVRKTFATYVGHFIVLVGIAAIAGYVLDMPILYFSLGASIPVALNTALSFVLLGWGLVLVYKSEKSQ